MDRVGADISGVWRVAGTFEMTANPHMIARTNSVKLLMNSAVSALMR